MYPLGKQFELDAQKAKSDKKAIIQGKYYRISIITERVIRLEYSKEGLFVDTPTQLIKKRKVGLPDFFFLVYFFQLFIISTSTADSVIFQNNINLHTGQCSPQYD